MNSSLQTQILNTDKSGIKSAITTLLSKIETPELCVNLIFFGKTNEQDYENDLYQIKQLVSLVPNLNPLVSFIPQPLCGTSTFALEVLLVSDPNSKSKVRTLNNARYIILNTDQGKYLMTEAIFIPGGKLNYKAQCKQIFDTVISIFEFENFDLNTIVRQWNYIGDIVGFENGNQHYQLFNNARTEFYQHIAFENGFPAATGISISINRILVSLIALIPAPEAIVYSIDNSLQIPAYNYTTRVLANCNSLKTTPKFERGKLIVCMQKAIFYISGTAAIRHEKSSFENDVENQTIETIENINYLLSAENLNNQHVAYNSLLNLRFVRIYIKNTDDYETINSQVRIQWPDVNALFLNADICRGELLVEIEGVAF